MRKNIRCRIFTYNLYSGSGLGSRGQGRTEAIKPQLKFDTTGVGHDPAKEFTDNWWDRAFNKAAKGIKVEEAEVRTVCYLKTLWCNASFSIER